MAPFGSRSIRSKSSANTSVFGDESAGTEFVLLYMRHAGGAFADSLVQLLLSTVESTAMPDRAQKDTVIDEVDLPMTPDEAQKEVVFDEIDSPLTPNVPGKEVALDEIDSPTTPVETSNEVGTPEEATPEEAGGMSLAQLREALEAGELTEEEFNMLAEEAAAEEEIDKVQELPPAPVVAAADTTLPSFPGESYIMSCF